MRSIFDPTGNNAEHDGSQNLGPFAGDTSQMPADIIDSVSDDDDEIDLVMDIPPFSTEAASEPSITSDQMHDVGEDDVLDIPEDSQGEIERRLGEHTNTPTSPGDAEQKGGSI